MSEMSTSGDLILEARHRAGLSQSELAQRLGTSQPAVARWEGGGTRPPMERVLEALHACDLDLRFRVVKHEDHDVVLGLNNLRLTPAGRMREHSAMSGFVGKAHRAAAARHRPRADRVSEGRGEPVPEFRPEEILRVLAARSVDYVLIGGLAGVLHGSPHSTRDVDICPSRQPANLDRLAATLRDLDAKLNVGGADPISFPYDPAFLARVSVLNTITRAGGLDLSFEPSGTRGHGDLRRAVEFVEVDGVPAPVPVASLADVIRSKEAAGRDKDRVVLHVLRELLRRQRD